MAFSKPVRKHLAETADKVSWLGSAWAAFMGFDAKYHLLVVVAMVIGTWVICQAVALYFLRENRKKNRDTS